MTRIQILQAATALGLIAVFTAATPASAQRRVPPTRPLTQDSVAAPPREQAVRPAPASARVPAVQQRAVPAEPLRQLVRTPPPVVPPASAVPVDSAVPAPAALARQAPPAPSVAASIAASPSAAARSVQPVSVVPAGATGRCKDGSYLTGSASESACESRGGLAVLFPPPRVAPSVRP